MQGMTIASLKKHTALIPLFVCVGLGLAGSFGYLVRLAVKNPDVAWINKRDGGASNEQYRDKQYKLYSPNLDYDKLECPAPKF